MTDRVKCPDCGGTGGTAYRYPGDTRKTIVYCSTCTGTCTIPERRKPTANDRAVERIKKECQDQINGKWCRDCENHAVEMLDIIREEAERG